MIDVTPNPRDPAALGRAKALILVSVGQPIAIEAYEYERVLKAVLHDPQAIVDVLMAMAMFAASALDTVEGFTGITAAERIDTMIGVAAGQIRLRDGA